MNIPTIAFALALFAAPALLPAQTTKPSSRPASTIATTDGYPLNVCLVSGKTLGKGTKVLQIKGHTLKVCSDACAEKVAKAPDGYIKKVDAAIIAQQGANYPLDTCLISKKKLGAMGKGRNLVVDGQLIRLCCGGCVKKAKTTLKDYVLGEIKTAAYLQQIKGHKNGKGLTCVVSNKPADRKGTAQLIMHGNTLIAVCCKGCLKKFKAGPNKYMAKMATTKSEPHGKRGDHDKGHEKDHDKDHDKDHEKDHEKSHDKDIDKGHGEHK